MKLYEVTNGYMASSYLRCHVVAANEERAKELGSIAFKEDAKCEFYQERLEEYKRLGLKLDHLEEYRYPEGYWTDLNVNCLFDNETEESYSEVDD